MDDYNNSNNDINSDSNITNPTAEDAVNPEAHLNNNINTDSDITNPNPENVTNPETQLNNESNASNSPNGNGYNSLSSSNREAFTRGLDNNYADRIARNKANLEQARARSNDPYKMKKGHEDEEKHADANNPEKDNFKEKNILDKAGDKADVLKNKASLLGSQIDNARSKAFQAMHPIEATKIVAKRKIRNWIIGIILSCLPFILCILFVIIFVVIIAGDMDTDDNYSSAYSSTTECGFSISDTSLSKSEFKQKIQDYANSSSSRSHWQIFADYANDYYDYAKAKGVNPEVVVLIAYKENGGKETTPGTNNYWGWGCPNGASKCQGLYSFMDGAKKVIDSASKYDTLMDWFVVGHYSYIGSYWYNPGGSGSGGCYYAPYIYPDGLPDRVANACAVGNKCSGSDCVKTTEEDQVAYANYLVYKVMATGRKSIFGLETTEGVICNNSNSNISTSSIVESYVQWMINFAADDTHGYSQSTRLMNPNVDCSSFVYYGLLKGAGFSTTELGGSYPFTTSTMINPLKKIGFKVYNYTSEADLQRGDILWYLGHTEVYVGNNKTVGAHSNRDGVDGDSSGTEVSVANNWADSRWTSYLRYEVNN